MTKKKTPAKQFASVLKEELARRGMPELKRGTKESTAFSGIAANVRSEKRLNEIIERADKIGWKLALNETVEKGRSSKPDKFDLTKKDLYNYERQIKKDIRQKAGTSLFKRDSKTETREMKRAREKALKTGNLEYIRETAKELAFSNFSKKVRDETIKWSAKDKAFYQKVNTEVAKAYLKYQEQLQGEKFSAKFRKEFIKKHQNDKAGFIAVAMYKTQDITEKETIKEVMQMVSFEDNAASGIELHYNNI